MNNGDCRYSSKILVFGIRDDGRHCFLDVPDIPDDTFLKGGKMELTWKKIKEKEQEETNRRFRRFAIFLILVIIITVAFSLMGYLVYLNVKAFRQLEKEKAKTENVLREKAGEAYGQFIPLYTRIQQEQIVREKI